MLALQEEAAGLSGEVDNICGKAADRRCVWNVEIARDGIARDCAAGEMGEVGVKVDKATKGQDCVADLEAIDFGGFGRSSRSLNDFACCLFEPNNIVTILVLRLVPASTR